MPGVDHPDVLVDACVEEREDRTAWQSEDSADTAIAKGPRQQRPAVVALLGIGTGSLGCDVRHGLAVYRQRSAWGAATVRG